MLQGLLLLDESIPSYDKHSFYVSGCNLEAYRIVTKKECNWPNLGVLIIGESGSGKSHLINIWKANNEAKNVSFQKEEFIELYNMMENCHNFVIEDVANIHDEIALLGAINIITEKKGKLLLTASSIPRYQNPDLQSRINAIYKVLIKKPDTELTRILIQKQFSDLQLRVNDNAIGYLVKKLQNKSFSYIKYIIETINKVSMQSKKEISVNMIRQIL